MSISAATTNHVVLVHGMWDTDRIFDRLRPHLQNAGFTVHSLDLTPPDGAVPLEVLAKQLDIFIQQTLEPGTAFHLIGFSMGGIVSRYYLQRLDGLARAASLITISSPHQGSILGWLSHKPGARQLAPWSRFLKDLNRDADCLSAIPFTSIWTPFDLIIFPAWSSVIPTAQPQLVPAPWHKWMIYDQRVFEQVIETLHKD